MKKKPNAYIDRIVTLSVWIMGLSFVGLILHLVLSPFDIGIGVEVRNCIFFVLIGLCLFLQGGLMIFINSGDGEEHEAVAPYAGRQKVGKKVALCASGALSLIGIVAIIVGFSLL